MKSREDADAPRGWRSVESVCALLSFALAGDSSRSPTRPPVARRTFPTIPSSSSYRSAPAGRRTWRRGSSAPTCRSILARSWSKITSAPAERSPQGSSPVRRPTATRCSPAPQARSRSVRNFTRMPASIRSRSLPRWRWYRRRRSCSPCNKSVPVHSVAELVAYAKANPGKLNYGAVIGTPPHLSGEMFKHITGANIVFVPYKSAAQATTDVVAGQMNMTFEGTTGISPFIKSGQLRALAVTALSAFPNCPTCRPWMSWATPACRRIPGRPSWRPPAPRPRSSTRSTRW